MAKQKKDILIALLPSQTDLGIAARKHWYRIPTASKNVPLMVQNGEVKQIAFYQPKIFHDDAFAVRWYANVKKISVVKRKKLFPNEPENPKSGNMYYKIEIDKLLRLPRAIPSLRHRRILFITSTRSRFDKAQEINDLFIESPLEEKMWREFKKNEIRAERQFLETIKDKNFFLDFAIFCRKSQLAVECDGDTYHNKKEYVQSDKRRDNQLESKGWNVLRYTTDDIIYNLSDTVLQIKETINKYGGEEDITVDGKYKYYPTDDLSDSLFG
jgi:very-short-patch-repair endonuclease